MIIDDKKINNQNINVIQNVILENRGKLSISGVNDVLSFDDQVVIVETELGLLTVKGENLRINKLSIDTSEVIVEGSINSISYSEKEFIRRLRQPHHRRFRFEPRSMPAEYPRRPTRWLRSILRCRDRAWRWNEIP